LNSARGSDRTWDALIGAPHVPPQTFGAAQNWRDVPENALVHKSLQCAAEYLFIKSSGAVEFGGARALPRRVAADAIEHWTFLAPRCRHCWRGPLGIGKGCAARIRRSCVKQRIRRSWSLSAADGDRTGIGGGRKTGHARRAGRGYTARLQGPLSPGSCLAAPVLVAHHRDG